MHVIGSRFCTEPCLKGAEYRLPNVFIKQATGEPAKREQSLSPGYPETLRLGPSGGLAVESRSGT
ncbi:hypothetical protein Bwad005_00070 [Bilophila wadsworthia]